MTLGKYEKDNCSDCGEFEYITQKTKKLCEKCRLKANAQDQIRKNTRIAISRVLSPNDIRVPKSSKSSLKRKTMALKRKSSPNKKAKSKKRPEKLSTLIKKLDKVFSQFIRLRDTDENGNGNCCTCSKNIHYKEGEAGHFRGRGRYSTRWEECNVNMQCHYCNNKLWGGGKQFEHSIYIDNKYPLDSVVIGPNNEGRTSEKLHFFSNMEFKPGKPWLRDEIEEYKYKVNELLKDKNFTI